MSEPNKPRVRVITHGGTAALQGLNPDPRTTVGKMMRQRVLDLASQMGGDLTPVQRRLVDQASRLAMMADLAAAAVGRHGVVDQQGALTPSAEAFVKAAREERELLRMIGQDRRSREVPSLTQYLEQIDERAEGDQ